MDCSRHQPDQGHCYEVISTYLPGSPTHDMLRTDRNPRTLSKITEELRELFAGLPQQWSQMICTESVWKPSSLQRCFGAVNSSLGETPTDISLCRTHHFHRHLLQAEKLVIPAVDHWQQNLQPEPRFNAKQWKTMYPPLINNKRPRGLNADAFL